MNANAKQVVVAAVVITGVITALGSFTKAQIPGPRIAIAGAVVGVTLAGLAEVEPGLAKAMALLMLSTAVLLDGVPALKAVSGLVTAGASTTTSSDSPARTPGSQKGLA